MNDEITSVGTGHCVHIIEDDPLILDILVFRFKDAGWQIVSSMNGEKGLEQLEAVTPDILLLDILLPGISGYEVLETIKSNERLKTVPVLVLSNYGQDSDIEKSKELGAVDHFVKANIIIEEIVVMAKQIVEGTYTPSNH